MGERPVPRRRSTAVLSERDRYYSAVVGSLTAVGIPTLDAAAVRRYVEALIDDVVDLAPAMRARISLHPAGCRRLGLHQVAQWGGSADPRRIHG